MASRKQTTDKRKIEVLCRQATCPLCGEILGRAEDVQFDHIIPLALGGSNEYFNLQAVHAKCHKIKTETEDVPRIAKAKRQEAAHLGTKKRKGRPIPGSKDSGIRKRMNGNVERW